MMDRQTLCVAFDGHQVVVRSDAPEVLVGIERIFRQMLEPEPTRIVGHFEVYGENDKYHLCGGRADDAGSRSLPDVLIRLKYKVIRHLIQARPDLLWFHAGAAAHGGHAVLFLGGCGQGKSTLVTGLCALGWGYLADDAVPLDTSSGEVFPFPQAPRVREDAGHVVLPEHLSQLHRNAVDLDSTMVCREAVPVAALVFPTYDPRAPTELVPYPPAAATLELLQHSVNFKDHRETAVRSLCKLVSRWRTFRLSFSDGELAARTVAQACQNWRQDDGLV